MKGNDLQSLAFLCFLDEKKRPCALGSNKTLSQAVEVWALSLYFKRQVKISVESSSQLHFVLCFNPLLGSQQ